MIFKKQSESYLSDPDVLLMLEFKAGDKTSFEKLMRKYFPRILNFIYRFVTDRALAEDLTQDVFMKVYDAASSYSPKAQFKTWLYIIARNISLNEIRKRRHKVVSLDEILVSQEGAMHRQVGDDSAVAPDQRMMHRERVAAVRKAIEGLPENQKMAVILRRYEKLSYEDIARTMGLSLEAVKSLLSRAKDNLKTSLQKWK